MEILSLFSHTQARPSGISVRKILDTAGCMIVYVGGAVLLVSTPASIVGNEQIPGPMIIKIPNKEQKFGMVGKFPIAST